MGRDPGSFKLMRIIEWSKYFQMFRILNSSNSHELTGNAKTWSKRAIMHMGSDGETEMLPFVDEE